MRLNKTGLNGMPRRKKFPAYAPVEQENVNVSRSLLIINPPPLYYSHIQ